jgi:hypothetical protein
VSARNDRLEASESVVAATCLVTRSQPIVAPIAISRMSRRPIRVIGASSTQPKPAAYVVARSTTYAIHTTRERRRTRDAIINLFVFQSRSLTAGG